MVPTFMVSAFSMNVKMPFAHGHPLEFWAIMALAGRSAISFFLFWRHKKW
jgi:Mg2+ and Co2+ transporter CorA